MQNDRTLWIRQLVNEVVGKTHSIQSKTAGAIDIIQENSSRKKKQQLKSKDSVGGRNKPRIRILLEKRHVSDREWETERGFLIKNGGLMR